VPEIGAAPREAPAAARRGGAWRLLPGVALLAALVLGSAALMAQREVEHKEVDLASAPAASDFFASALQGLDGEHFAGARVRSARRRQEVSLHTDKRGDVNLNVDIERNGKLVGREAGLKVPVGKTTRLQLALPRKGRLQELDEDVPVAPAFAGDDAGAGAELGEGGGADEDEEPVDDDDTSELGAAKKQVMDAKERVVEDAKRLHDISDAITEESEKAENAEDYKAAAMEGEESAKRRAIEEVEEEKEALRAAKKRADTLAITKEAEAMKAKMEAAEAKSEAKTAKARADAAEQAAQLELEKKKEELAADAEQQAWDKYEAVRVTCAY
jgi:hypothetical protein